MALVVGISGRKQSGKDTVADHAISQLQTKYNGIRCEKFGFATELKREVHVLFNIPYEILYGTDDQKNQSSGILWNQMPYDYPKEKYMQYMSVRELLQVWGTEIVRHINPDAWIDAFMTNVLDSKSDIIFCIDARYPNEIDTGLHERLDAYVIRLTRAVFTEDQHSSETALDPENYDWNKFDLVVPNHKMELEDTKHMTYQYVLDYVRGHYGS